MYDLSRHPQWKRIQSICQKFHASGFEIYLVGGCVRDALLGTLPKDFDFSTNAKPDEIEALFEKTNPIGKAFGTIQVVIDGETYEVTTFRKDLDYKDGRHPEAIEFTNAEEDAKRRDFKMNALFLDPLSGKILDFVNGRKDIEAQQISFIGEAEERIREDKLRMLRAVRFSAQLNFSVDESAKQAIHKHAAEISQVSRERTYSEITKMFSSVHFSRGLGLIEELEFFAFLYPELLSLEKKQKDLHLLLNLIASSSYFVDFWARYPEEKGSDLHSFYLSFFFAELGSATKSVEKILRKWKFSKKEITRLQNWLFWKDEFTRELSLSFLKKQMHKEGFAFFRGTLLLGINSSLPHNLLLLEKILHGKLVEDFRLPINYVTSQDLSQRGVSPGKFMGEILDAVYDQQLEEKISSRDEALAFIENKISKT